MLRNERSACVCSASNLFPSPCTQPCLILAEMPDALGWWLSPGCPAPSLSAVAQALQPCHCSRGSYSHWGCVPGEQERLTLPAGSWHVSGLCSYLHFQHRQQQKFPLEAFSLRSYTIFLSNVFCLAEWKTWHPSPLCVLMPFGGSRLPD